LEPEILLIDEVLAVGDISFQRKCLGKMGNVVQQGRTVIFVSHQLAMVNTLCETAMLLDRGKIVDHGVTTTIVEKYLQAFLGSENTQTHVVYQIDQKKKAQLIDSRVVGPEGKDASQIDVFDRITVCISFEIREPMEGISVNLVVKRNGEVLFVSFETDDQPELLRTRLKGKYYTAVDLPSPLKAGRYSLDIYIGKINVGGIDEQLDTLAFQVDDKSFDSSIRSYSSKRPGVMAAHLQWRTKSIH
jgi:lipopolysaccharide transport system ATP-binding protein